MRVKSLRLPKRFKRFADLEIVDLPAGEREVFDFLLDAHVSSLEDAAHMF